MPTNKNQTPRPLPAELPKEPWPLFQSWLDEAVEKEIQPHPTAMTLASVDLEGRPAARVVMCRGVDTKQGWLVFYTNQRSPKASELEANPRASLIFHWDPLRRQARIDGPVTHAPAADSDAYFASRPLDSQISAWASDQSEPIPSREALLKKVSAAEARFGVQHGEGAGVRIPRPSHWGGYRVWVERMELWVGLPGRNHDRGLWTRTLTPAGDAFTAGAWRVTRLQP